MNWPAAVAFAAFFLSLAWSDYAKSNAKGMEYAAEIARLTNENAKLAHANCRNTAE